jgi:DUF438 domain-containing protein
MNNRIKKLAYILKQLISGEEPLFAENEFLKVLGEINPEELAQAEEMLLNDGVSIEDIQRANELHTELVKNKILIAAGDMIDQYGHPAFVFKGENKGIEKFLDEQLKPDLEAYLKNLSEKERDNLHSDAVSLENIIRHYDRKENLFFPYLERAGITVPPQVMWGVDDIIRDLIRLFIQAIEQQPVIPKRIRMIYDRLCAQIESMITKENDILIPMLSQYMTEEDWLLTARESIRMGYVFNQGIEGASNSDAMTWLEQYEKNKNHYSDYASEKNDHVEHSNKEKIILPSGRFTQKQLITMLNTLPTDLTFIDCDDIIQYYSEGKHQVFARTRTIIGRNVYLCHPPQLVPTIRKLIESFKKGEKDYLAVPVRKGSQLNLVRYYAVRDEQGKYIGTVEVTEEISEILEMVSDK